MLWEQTASWRAPFAPRRRIEAAQRERLRRIVRHAARHIPFYQRSFRQHGFDPFARDDFDLGELPLTSKAALKQAPVEDRIAPGVDLAQCVISETSGSTGEPILIAHTRQEAARFYGRRLRAQTLGGLRPWHKRAVLGYHLQRRWPHRLGLFRIQTIPLELDAVEIMDRLTAIQPEILRGPPSGLERVAEERPDELAALRLRVVFSGAEQLSARGRRRIEQAAGCRVLDFYGASECNLIAWQCGRCGLYHTCDDSLIVEVLRDGRPVGPGEEGEIYITGLDGFAMPFLRYQVGDIVRLPAAAPDCKVQFGAIESIQGRIIDYLDLPGGRKLSPYTLMNELDELQNLHRYEAEQTQPDSVVVRFQVEAGRPEAETRIQVLERCRRVIPGDVRIDLELVERFELDPATKRRFVRSTSRDGVT